MDTNTLKRLIRLIGERLYDKYKKKLITLTVPTYNTANIKQGDELFKLIEVSFLTPYFNAIEGNWYPERNLREELKLVLNTIKKTIEEYEKDSKEREQNVQDGFKLDLEVWLKGVANGQRPDVY